jgi:hypothetical protein
LSHPIFWYPTRLQRETSSLPTKPWCISTQHQPSCLPPANDTAQHHDDDGIASEIQWTQIRRSRSLFSQATLSLPAKIWPTGGRVMINQSALLVLTKSSLSWAIHRSGRRQHSTDPISEGWPDVNCVMFFFSFLLAPHRVYFRLLLRLPEHLGLCGEQWESGTCSSRVG